MTGFRVEADMLAPLLNHSAQLTAPFEGKFQALFEVQSASGIPDILLIAFDETEINRRMRSGLRPLVDAADVAVMTTLSRRYSNDGCCGTTCAQLAVKTGLTPGYLSSMVMKRLEKLGHVEQIARGRWIPTHPFTPLARHVISIEAKLSDWRAGLWQAHKQAADTSWLVIDAKHAGRVRQKLDRFDACKVGVASLASSSGALEVMTPTQQRTPHPTNRNLLIERGADLYSAGLTSGPLAPVFGRMLLATTGVDPRLQDAVAH
jgi:hypothetical protein